MKPLLKTFFIMIVLVFTQVNLSAQTKTLANSFVILNNKLPEKTAFYTKSIEAADMEQYRLRDKRVHLEFENGFEVELYSAKELFVKGEILNINNYPVTHGTGKLPVFGILPNGHLTAKVFSEMKK
ncbi:MAG TPA: hypothetical protein VNZ49_17795 [Bacteroidia bacterium]|jgi:hypothetical protein|nr:hypothetical protein [Bacteroidia bacterium]